MIVDANVINGYYQESILERDSELTARVSNIIENISHDAPLYLDFDGQIEEDWKTCNNCEWLEGWIAHLLQADLLRYIHPKKLKNIRKELLGLGFPRNSKDLWYIRTAVAVGESNGISLIISEDMDFFDPTRKGCDRKQRLKVLTSTNSPVRKFLKRNYGVIVVCVKEHVAGGTR